MGGEESRENQNTEVKTVAGSAGLVSHFTLWGGCLFKENYNVYSKLWAAALRGRAISESWAINQLWDLVTELLAFRRVGETEEREERKGEKGAGWAPASVGMTLILEQEGHMGSGLEVAPGAGGEQRVEFPWHSSHGTKLDGNHSP